jgi:hypothetical protein
MKASVVQIADQRPLLGEFLDIIFTKYTHTGLISLSEPFGRKFL